MENFETGAHAKLETQNVFSLLAFVELLQTSGNAT